MRENRSGSLGPWRCLLPLEVALRSRGALRPPPSSTATAERCSPSAPAPACQGTRTGPRDGNHLAKVRVAGSNPVSGAMSGSSKAERTKRAKTAAHRRDRPGTLRHPRRPEHGGTTAATQAARRRAQATERQGLWRERERRVGGANYRIRHIRGRRLMGVSFRGRPCRPVTRIQAVQSPPESEDHGIHPARSPEATKFCTQM